MDFQRLRLLHNLVQVDRDKVHNDVSVARLVHEERRRRRTYWIRPWVIRRPILGQYGSLMQELRVEDVAGFRNFIRMEPAMFRELLERLGPRITKQDTFYRYS